MITKNYIKELLINRRDAVERAIIVLYQYQTDKEKQQGSTIYKNDVGFNSPDGHVLSKFARYLQKGYILSDNQICIARTKLLKYSGQLARISNEKKKEKQIA